MKVCLFAEGCYPYTVGGASAWTQMLISSLSDIEFAVQTVIVSKEESGKFKYKLPPNVTEIKEAYLNDTDNTTKSRRHLRMSKKEKEAFRGLVFGQNIQWNLLFDFFYGTNVSVNDVLMGKDFFEIVKEYYDIFYNRTVFTDFLWTFRSVFLPVFLLLKNNIPSADVYHSISTGYAGMLGCCAKHIYKRPLLLTEHGIYTREREEEIIRINWTKGVYKDLWISHFYKLSHCIYDRADWVVSLFGGARELQEDIGCSAHKTEVISNGIDIDQFKSLPQKEIDDGFIDVGAVVRVSPIKDIKTMITVFSYAKERDHRLRLYIMGPDDEDPEYFSECKDLVETLGVKDIIFTGRINVKEYLGKMDIILLTSISEGQPLSIMEAMAAGKPCVTTKVGDCYDILNAGDASGACGIVVPVMNVSQLANAIITLAKDPKLRKKYGENGIKRVKEKYVDKDFLERYHEIYKTMYTGREPRKIGWDRI